MLFELTMAVLFFFKMKINIYIFPVIKILCIFGEDIFMTNAIFISRIMKQAIHVTNMKLVTFFDLVRTSYYQPVKQISDEVKYTKSRCTLHMYMRYPMICINMKTQEFSRIVLCHQLGLKTEADEIQKDKNMLDRQKYLAEWQYFCRSRPSFRRIEPW